MTADQLDIVAGRTGHERFRWLTSEANPDVASRDGYRTVVRRMAEDEPTPAIEPTPTQTPLSDSLRARRVGFKHCPESSPASC